MIIKRLVLLFCGICWFLFGAGFVLLMVQYVGGLVGWELFGLAISSGSVLLGMAHVIGLFAGMVLCFAIGVLFCAHGMVRPERVQSPK